MKRSLPRFSFDEAPTRPRGAVVAPAAETLAPAPAKPPVKTHASGVMRKVRAPAPPPLPPTPATHPPGAARPTPSSRPPTRPPPLPVVETAMPFALTRVKTVPPPAARCVPDDRPTLLPTLLVASAKPKRWKRRIVLLVVAGALAWAHASSLSVTARSAFERGLAYISEHGH